MVDREFVGIQSIFDGLMAFEVWTYSSGLLERFFFEEILLFMAGNSVFKRH